MKLIVRLFFWVLTGVMFTLMVQFSINLYGQLNHTTEPRLMFGGIESLLWAYLLLVALTIGGLAAAFRAISKQLFSPIERYFDFLK